MLLMTDNLNSIISYINCYWWNKNEVSAEKVGNLFKKYSVSSEEKKKVYDIIKTSPRKALIFQYFSGAVLQVCCIEPLN